MKMSEDGFLDWFLDEPNMEIQIDTLMGTSFDMRVSSTDTIREIKQRIQRVEGIPIHQQNLIFHSKELKDSRRLCDAGIRNGSTIKLVVSMKGGPISTRRLSISCEHRLMIKELKELLETARDEIGDKLAPGSKVSVLVFKEGDILNLLRVIENEDGSYSPYNEKPISPPSRTVNQRHKRCVLFDKMGEDTDMMMKISNLRKKMDDINMKRRLRNVDESSSKASCSKPNYAYKLLNELPRGDANDLNDDDSFLDVVDVTKKKSRSDDEASTQSETEEIALKDKHRIRKKSIFNETGGFSLTKQNYTRINKVTRLVSQKQMPESIELEENAQTWEVHDSLTSERLKSPTSVPCKFGTIVKRRQSLNFDDKSSMVESSEKSFGHFSRFGSSSQAATQFMTAGATTKAPSAIPAEYAPKDDDELCDFFSRAEATAGNGRSPLYGRNSEIKLTRTSNSNKSSSKSNSNDDDEESDEFLHQIYGYLNLGSELLDATANNVGTSACGKGAVRRSEMELPPVVIKKKSRCCECNRRLNITNIYNCRCGKIFCSQHRYSEVHRCSYDYKTEGRRILEHENPLVTADKVHRI